MSRRCEIFDRHPDCNHLTHFCTLYTEIVSKQFFRSRGLFSTRKVISGRFVVDVVLAHVLIGRKKVDLIIFLFYVLIRFMVACTVFAPRSLNISLSLIRRIPFIPLILFQLGKVSFLSNLRPVIEKFWQAIYKWLFSFFLWNAG